MVSKTILNTSNEALDDLQPVSSYLQHAPQWWKEIFIWLDPKTQLRLSKSIQFLPDAVKVRMSLKDKDWVLKDWIVTINNKPIYANNIDAFAWQVQNQHGVTYASFDWVKNNDFIPENIRLDGFIMWSLCKMMPAGDYALGTTNKAVWQLYTLLWWQYEWCFFGKDGKLIHSAWWANDQHNIDVESWYIMTSSYSKATWQPFVVSVQRVKGDNTDIPVGSFAVMDPTMQAPTYTLKEPVQFL